MSANPTHSKRSAHPDLTRRVRLVMAWNHLVPASLKWNVVSRKPGCVLVKDRRP